MSELIPQSEKEIKEKKYLTKIISINYKKLIRLFYFDFKALFCLKI